MTTRFGEENSFSVELGSKEDLNKMTLQSGFRGGVVMEGVIGTLSRVRLADGIVLEVTGNKGTVRVDLDEPTLREALREGGGRPVQEKSAYVVPTTNQDGGKSGV